jgi:CcmD family protein
MDHLSYLLAAYSVIFTAIFLYLVFIWRRQSRIETDIRTAEALLKEVRAELAAHTANAPRPAVH